METPSPSKRSDTQNRSLHLFFTLISRELNDHGLDIKEVMSHAIDCPWTPESVKELMWRRIQRRLFNKESTKDLDRHKEINLIYDVINRFLSTEFGISVPFPSQETLEKMSEEDYIKLLKAES